jgi:L-amino acid N-acyltransferase YncA
MGSAVMGHCLQRKAKPTRDGRARVARCKTWRMIDDGYMKSAIEKDTPASEVKVKVEPRGGGGEALTSFSPAVQLQLTTSSMPTVMTDFSSLDSPTTAHTLDNLPAPAHFTEKQTRQTDDSNMTSLQTQGRKRVKYKEPPMLEESTTATKTSETQASRAQTTEPPHTPTHSADIDLAALTSACITSPLEITLNPIESAAAPAHHSPSSSAAPDHNLIKITDSAVEMGGKRKPLGRKKKQPHPLTEDDQELVFKGRSVGRSNVTNASSSWRWDPNLGALVSNNSGASYRPPMASQALDQGHVAVSKPGPAAVSSTKLENSLWAKETTADNGWGVTGDQNDWQPTPAKASWDSGHPPYPNKARLDAEASKRREQVRNAAKAINHNGRTRKPKESPWIKDSLIPKSDPNRHKIRWSSRESFSSDSNRASSGWGTRRKRDQNNSVELADWAGGIGPASIDWDSRSRFRDHQSAEKIENWLDQNFISMEQVEAAIIATDGSSFTQGLGDIAPKYWFVAHLDGKSAKFFWQQHIDPQDDDVKPCDEEDLRGAMPWWDDYVDNEHDMLKPFEHPEEAGIHSSDENTEQRRARENDKGAVNAGENRKAAERAKREVQRKRALAKRARAHKVSGMHDPSSRAIKPGLSLFLRPATKEDIVPLRAIYNRYIDNAFVVPETDRLTEADMLARWQAIKNAKLPFIVACQRGEVIKARNKKLHEDMIMPDKVVGFACAADWSDGTCIYRPTVKLGVFVHMEQYMKQVGSCLADKIMALLDPQFADRGGYDVDEPLRGEPYRTVSNVLVRYSYEAGKTDKLEWVSKWLKSRFGFQQVADLQGVAEKFDKQ